MKKFIVSQRFAERGVGFPIFIAPMVGISNLAFRKLVRSYTPASIRPFLFTEMLSSRRLSSSKLNLVGETRFCPESDSPLIAQLLGNEERHIVSSVQKLSEAKVSGIDINMGCPVARTLRYNWGIKLMSDTSYASKVVEITRKNYCGLLSVKLRVSHNDQVDMVYLDHLTKALEESGADWLTIHSRTRAEKHSGAGHWEAVGEMAKKRKIPVVLNGNIQNANDALRAFNEVPVDGVMIGRAAIVRPWILWQCAQALGLCEEKLRPPLGAQEEGLEFINAMLRLVGYYREDLYEEKYAVHQIQYLLGHANRWLDFGHDLWKKSTRARSLVELETLFLFYKNNVPLKMQESIVFH